MCGIAGYFNKSIDIEYGKSLLQDFTQILKHRGPDNQGYYQNKNVGLAHTRLSIVDLSNAANQPMVSQNQKFQIIFNGEIYNFKELIIKYKLQNILKTTSDTEVIIELFSMIGSKVFQQLNGMFAIAIYDLQLNKLIIARDQNGKKPLYYSYNNITKEFYFGSELKIFKNIKTISKKIDHQSIEDFFHCGNVSGDKSIFKEIKKLKAGCILNIDENQFSIEEYHNWDLEFLPQKSKLSFADSKKELTSLLHQSVKLRLISDVPYGSFLSGGIDSSLITAIASREAGTQLNTFSIGFEDQSRDESKYATQVSKYLKTNHQNYILKDSEALALFDQIEDIYDEPFADTSMIPTLLVSQMARRNVKMVLSGDGGDELFMGYGSYTWAKRLNKPVHKIAKKPFKFIFSKMSNRFQRISEMYHFDKNIDLKKHIFSQEQYYFSQKEIDRLMIKKTIIKNKILDLSHLKLSKAEQQAYFDFTHYLRDDLLVKVDRASMAHSLEVRSPLLDINVVKHAFNMPESYKHIGNDRKIILKSILYDYIPAQYFDRPKKGFSIPLANWLRNDLLYLVQKYTAENMILKYNIVQYQEVKFVLDMFFKNGKDYYYNRLWLIICMHKWLEKNNDWIEL